MCPQMAKSVGERTVDDLINEEVNERVYVYVSVSISASVSIYRLIQV